jgi:hypothetical protein
VIDGGIWMNTQRPEWNDANNALVGHGLSMVTMYYLRRYIHFLRNLLAVEEKPFPLSNDVGQWLTDTGAALRNLRPLLDNDSISETARYQSMVELGQAASRYRQKAYQQDSFSGNHNQPPEEVTIMLDDALAAIDHSIVAGRREDGLYDAYNLLNLKQKSASIDALYPMLEGQVAALSAGTIPPDEVVDVLEALFESDVYRPGQRSFMLYPDRQLPGFLEKNRIDEEQVDAVPLLVRMLSEDDKQIVVRDADGCYRFNADFKNVGDLNAQLDSLATDYGDEINAAREPLQDLYESVFQHRSFTGRSGTMFGFEGLGSIYWHMVSKLMLAVLENFFAALDQDTDAATVIRLGQMYYRVREGIGFNKTPAEYGAFPTDPYSHTPKHGGARQPGMTGQVKEEILCRFGELGARISNGIVRFQPSLLRRREFLAKTRDTGYVDVDGNWQTIKVPTSGLAFTWCQVPIIYELNDDAEPGITIARDDGKEVRLQNLTLPAKESSELFERSGRIRLLTVTFASNALFPE